MDDDQGADQQDEEAIIDRGARYELTLGPLGHEIWDLDAPEGAAPVATYPVTGQGFEAAWALYGRLSRGNRIGRSRSRFARPLFVTTIVASVLLGVSGIAYSIVLFVTLSGTPSQHSLLLLRRVQALDQALYQLVIGLLAIHVALWIRRRMGEVSPPLASPRQDAADPGAGSVAT
jgi:hypothetical protein